jgi:hypothetical protein
MLLGFVTPHFIAARQLVELKLYPYQQLYSWIARGKSSGLIFLKTISVVLTHP